MLKLVQSVKPVTKKIIEASKSYLPYNVGAFFINLTLRTSRIGFRMTLLFLSSLVTFSRMSYFMIIQQKRFFKTHELC